MSVLSVLLITIGLADLLRSLGPQPSDAPRETRGVPAAGVLLLVLGATYERRRQQAREAIAWVGQMR